MLEDKQLKLPKSTNIQDFIGIITSCKVKGQSIQIHDSTPTSIFTLEIEKKMKEQAQSQLWTVKVSIGQIIDLANKLNLKYSSQERSLPILEVSIVELQA